MREFPLLKIGMLMSKGGLYIDRWDRERERGRGVESASVAVVRRARAWP